MSMLNTENKINMDKSMLGDLDNLPEEDKLRMSFMIDQLQIRDSLAAQGTHLWLDTSSVNAAIVNTYKSVYDRYMGSLRNKTKGMKMHDSSNSQSGRPAGVYKSSPIFIAKAVKNHVELEGMQNSHLRKMKI